MIKKFFYFLFFLYFFCIFVVFFIFFLYFRVFFIFFLYFCGFFYLFFVYLVVYKTTVYMIYIESSAVLCPLLPSGVNSIDSPFHLPTSQKSSSNTTPSAL